MANEVTVSCSVRATKGGATVTQTKSFNITMTGDDMQSGTQVIGTSAEVLDFGEIAGIPCAVMVQNLDATNYVDLSLINDGSTPFAKLLAGQAMIFPPGSATIYAKANTAAVRVAMTAVEA